MFRSVPWHGYLILLLSAYLFVYGRPQSETTSDKELLGWPSPKEVQRRLPYYLLGQSKNGSSVWYVPMGKWDLHELVGSSKGYDAAVDHLKGMVENIFNTKSVGQSKNNAMGIINYEGYGLKQLIHFPTTRFYMECAKVTDTAVRQTGLKKSILINVNPAFLKTFEMVRPLMGNMVEKIELYGTDPEEWKSVLLNEISRDQVPPFLGGTHKHSYIERYD